MNFGKTRKRGAERGKENLTQKKPATAQKKGKVDLNADTLAKIGAKKLAALLFAASEGGPPASHSNSGI